MVSSQLFKWKKALRKQGYEVFKSDIPSKSPENARIEKIYAKIWRLIIEDNFLAKVLGEIKVEKKLAKAKAFHNQFSKRSRALLLQVNLASI